MKSRKGFTLIELIVSIALIGIVFVTILNALDTGLLNIVRAGNRTTNTVAAANSILTDPTSVSENLTIPVKLPIEGSTTVTVNVPGSYGTGIGIIGTGGYGSVSVEIEAFIPGLEGVEP